MRFALPVALLLAAVALAGCGSHGDGIPRLSFDAAASQPLGFVDRGVVASSGAAAVHDVSFESGGRRVDGYLLVPPGAQKRPAVLLVHGSGGDRQELLGAANALAARRFVALTITEPSTSPPAPAKTRTGLIAQQRDIVVADVVAARRAVRLLGTLPWVDPARIGYLGWSAGARTGAYVAASEPHVRALALLSAGADPISAFVSQAPKDLRPVVRADLGSVDPLRYIGRARGHVLLEDGTKDTVVPHEALLNMAHAAPKGTVVRWYAAGHELNAKAYSDAFDWLERELG